MLFYLYLSEEKKREWKEKKKPQKERWTDFFIESTNHIYLLKRIASGNTIIASLRPNQDRFPFITRMSKRDEKKNKIKFIDKILDIPENKQTKK